MSYDADNDALWWMDGPEDDDENPEPGAHTLHWEVTRAEVLSDPDECTEHESHADAVRAVLAWLDVAADQYFEDDDPEGYNLVRDLQRDVRALKTDEPWQDTVGHFTYALRTIKRPLGDA